VEDGGAVAEAKPPLSHDEEDRHRLDDRAFDALEDEVERLAAEGERGSSGQTRERRAKPDHLLDPAHDEDDFRQIVEQAIDSLPDAFLRALERVAIVVSDDGKERHAYGLYWGRKLGHDPVIGGPVSAAVPDQIVIFRDTLVRDFGADPALLREQIARVVRHEVGHHLGFDEDGVRRLGL